MGEDAAAIASSKGSYHWDKRNRKYVQLQPGETMRAGKRMRSDAGTPVSSVKVTQNLRDQNQMKRNQCGPFGEC